MENQPTGRDLLAEAITLIQASIASKETALSGMSVLVPANCEFIVMCAGAPLTFDVDREKREVSNPRGAQPEDCVTFNKTDADKLAATIHDSNQRQAIVVPRRTAITSALDDARTLLAEIQAAP